MLWTNEISPHIIVRKLPERTYERWSRHGDHKSIGFILIRANENGLFS